MKAGESLYLLYHELRELPVSYTYSLSCLEFEEHVALCARLQQTAPIGSLRPEITFDDGHRSNFQHALPLLTKHSVKGEFFLTVGWIGMRAEYMDWKHVRELHQAGHRIGAHGMTHTLLTQCDPKQLEGELGDSRRRLEDELGAPITTMSLPGGRSNRRVLAACQKAGYERIFTSEPRAEQTRMETLVGRVNVRAAISAAWLEDLLQPGSGALARLNRQYRLKELAKAALGDRMYGTVWSLLNHQEAAAGDELDA